MIPSIAIAIVICIGIIISAILVVTLRGTVSAVISCGLTGLLASILFLILAAPDVAMTEAAIGSGLTTMIFLFAIGKTKKVQKNG